MTARGFFSCIHGGPSRAIRANTGQFFACAPGRYPGLRRNSPVIWPPVKRNVLEKLNPLSLRARMVRVEPGGEGAVFVTQDEHAPRVLDGRLDLEAVADNAGVAQQPRALALAVGGHAGGIEAVVGDGEAL